MSESATRSELGQVLDAIQSMQTQLQELTLEVRTNQVETREKFNTVRTEIQALRTEVKGDIEVLSTEIQALRTELSELTKR